MTAEEVRQLYVSLIEHAKANNPQKRTIGYDCHHNIPKCKSCGGSNEQWNLVFLSWREHFKAHMLLAEIYPENSQQRRDMTTALCLMHGEKYDMTPEEYEYTRKLNSETLRGKSYEELYGKEKAEKMISNNRQKQTGKTFTEEHKQKLKISWQKIEIREKRIQTQKETNKKPEIKQKRQNASKEATNRPEVKEKIRLKNIGQKRTKKTKQKISASRKGKKASENARKNMSNAQSGKKLSITHIENISISGKIAQSNPKTISKKSKSMKTAHALRRLGKRIAKILQIYCKIEVKMNN